jgi:hypothetical protein
VIYWKQVLALPQLAGWKELVGPVVDQRGPAELVVVNTADGQYRIEDPNQPVINAWPTPVDGLTTGEDGWFVVLTGVEWGLLDVTLQRLPVTPEAIANGWDAVAERGIRITGPSLNMVTTSLDLLHVIPIDTPGWHIARVHARGRMGRLAKRHQPGGEEEHLLQLWPTVGKPASRLLVGPDDYGQLLLE